MTRRRLFTSMLLLDLLVLIGCGPTIPMGEVEGTLTQGGKPLDRIQVEFWPEDNGPRSIGETDKDGRYHLKSDDGKFRGARLGTHRIVLRDVGVLGEKFLGRAAEGVDMSQGRKPRVKGAVMDPQMTPLKREVKSGKNTIDLDLSRP